jgi:tetratricopeptide (TPR) repeat protein
MQLSSSKRKLRVLIVATLFTLFAAPMRALGVPNAGDDGKKCYRANQREAIIRYCTQAISSAKLPADALALAFYRRGNAYNEKSESDRAIQDYNEAIRLNPGHADAFANRGAAYARKRDYDRAIQDYDEAIRLNPRHADAFSNRGVVYARKKDYERAIQDYDDAIRLKPDHIGALYARGNAYRRRGDYDQAVRNYDQVVRLNPRHAQAYSNRGIAYASQGHDDLAIQDYDEAIRINPEHVNAYYNRGNAYRRKGAYGKAVENYSQVIRLNPKHGNGYSSRGMVRFYQGQFASAAADFSKARRFAPDNLYLALLLHVAEARAGIQAQAAQTEMARRGDLESWPGPILAMLVGKLPEHVILNAGTSSDQPEKRCQAYFYLGQKRLMQQKKSEAAEMFRQAVATQASTLFESRRREPSSAACAINGRFQIGVPELSRSSVYRHRHA